MYFVIYPFLRYRFIITGIFFHSNRRSWVWLAVLRQCLDSASAVEQPPTAIPRTKHGQVKN